MYSNHIHSSLELVFTNDSHSVHWRLFHSFDQNDSTRDEHFKGCLIPSSTFHQLTGLWFLRILYKSPFASTFSWKKRSSLYCMVALKGHLRKCLRKYLWCRENKIKKESQISSQIFVMSWKKSRTIRECLHVLFINNLEGLDHWSLRIAGQPIRLHTSGSHFDPHKKNVHNTQHVKTLYSVRFEGILFY